MNRHSSAKAWILELANELGGWRDGKLRPTPPPEWTSGSGQHAVCSIIAVTCAAILPRRLPNGGEGPYRRVGCEWASPKLASRFRQSSCWMRSATGTQPSPVPEPMMGTRACLYRDLTRRKLGTPATHFIQGIGEERFDRHHRRGELEKLPLRDQDQWRRQAWETLGPFRHLPRPSAPRRRSLELYVIQR